jgi:hypothetical protein
MPETTDMDYEASSSEEAVRFVKSAMSYMETNKGMTVRLAFMALYYDPNYSKAWIILSLVAPFVHEGKEYTRAECFEKVDPTEQERVLSRLRVMVSEL